MISKDIVYLHEEYSNFRNTIDHSHKNIQDLRKYPILYINLDDSVDRKNGIREQASIMNVSIHRISAIDYRSINYPYWTEEQKKEYACALSHLKAMRYAFDQGWETVVILEDDVFFGLIHYWLQTLSELIANLDHKWEMVNLSYLYHDNMGKPPYIKKGIYYGAVGYCVHRRGMETINDFQPENNHHLKFDRDIYRLFVPNAYTSTFPYFIPFNDKNKMDSTIHKHHTNNHIKASTKWLKNLKNFVKKMKQ